MFQNLTPNQKVISLIGLFLIVFLAIPYIQRTFYSLTAKEYEPWDPENMNAVKLKISHLNNEGEQINYRLTVLPALLNSLRDNKDILATIEIDSAAGVQEMMENLKTDVIFKDLYINYYDYDFKQPQRDRILDDVQKSISNLRRIYNNRYDKLAQELHYNPYENYYNDYNSNRTDTIPKPLANGAKETKETKPSLEAFKKFIGLHFKTIDTSLSSRIAQDKAKLPELTSQLDKLKDDFNKKNFNINQYAVLIGIPFFIIAALLMYWYGLRASNRITTPSGLPATGEDLKIGLSFTLNTITVLLLILSLLILGLAKVIAENTLAALLGTIGGYVLNANIERSARGSATQQPINSPQPSQ